MDTIMTKESNFELSESKINEWVNQAMELLGQYDYNPNANVLATIFRKWSKAKGWLVDLFKKSEFYNGNGQIIIPANLKRPIDKEGIMTFYCWATDEYKDILSRENEIMIGLIPLAEYERNIDRVCSTYSNLPDKAYLNGFPKQYYYEEYIRMVKRRDKTTDKCSTYTIWSNGYERKVPREIAEKCNQFERLISNALNTSGEDTPWIISEEKANKVNEYCEKIGVNARCVVGQKVTKFIGKLLRELGMNKIVDIQEETWMHNGETMTRQKDMGYNYHFALLGDSINPLEYTKEVVISVNPLDYWTMSLGYKWSSCHTIDKEDVRGVRENQHGGCYSGGTEAYLLDESTIVVYIRPTEKELESIDEADLPMENQSKFKRCLFYLGEDKLVQSRVYPDGRDGGDEGLAGQLRAIMQKVISELYDTPNIWTLRKGISACGEAIYTVRDIHYPDYDNYSDCNVSYLRRIDGQLNFNMIKVGVDYIICPSCGESHCESNHITCDECYENRNGRPCERCRDRCEDDAIIITDDDGTEHVFCCMECAEYSGYIETEDEGWVYDNGNLYYDEYTGSYYVHGEDGIWIDDDWYAYSYNAECDGWRWSDIDDTWIWRTEADELAKGGYFMASEHEDAVKTPGGWYLSIEDATEDGWILGEDGTFTKAAA